MAGPRVVQGDEHYVARSVTKRTCFHRQGAEDCPCPRRSLTDLPTLCRADHTNTGLLGNIIGLAQSRGVGMLEKRDGPHTAQARRHNIHSPCLGSPGTGKATVYGYPLVVFLPQSCSMLDEVSMLMHDITSVPARGSEGSCRRDKKDPAECMPPGPEQEWESSYAIRDSFNCNL
jgi:hypothetical protein